MVACSECSYALGNRRIQGANDVTERCGFNIVASINLIYHVMNFLIVLWCHKSLFSGVKPCSLLVLGFFVIPWVVLAKIIVSLMESGTCGDVTGVCDPFLVVIVTLPLAYAGSSYQPMTALRNLTIRLTGRGLVNISALCSSVEIALMMIRP
jgi:hypothetical protein